MNRGRPAGRMTQRRKQVLDVLAEQAGNGEPLSFCRIARRLGVGYDYRNVRRIRNDLIRMGKLEVTA